MNLFFAFLYQLLYDWQRKRIENEKKAALISSATLGILFGMNLMIISYLVSLLFFDMVITFLRSYYIYTALAIVFTTIFVMLFNKRYENLLIKASKQEKNIHAKYITNAIVFIVITLLGYIFVYFTLFNYIYFGK